jgi:hypothetical protein
MSIVYEVYMNEGKWISCTANGVLGLGIYERFDSSVSFYIVLGYHITHNSTWYGAYTNRKEGSSGAG